MDEVQATVATTNVSLLPLLIPCPNRTASLGINQDKFMLTSAPSSATSKDQMCFLGKLVGMAVRHDMVLGLDLSGLVWRSLVRVPVSLDQLRAVDTGGVDKLKSVVKLGLHLETASVAVAMSTGRSHASAEGAEEHKGAELSRGDSSTGSRAAGGSAFDRPNQLDLSTYSPPEWEDLCFTVTLSDGTTLPLIPVGEEVPVTMANWRDYVTLAEHFRLRESASMLDLFRRGLAQVHERECCSCLVYLVVMLLLVVNGRGDVVVVFAYSKCIIFSVSSAIFIFPVYSRRDPAAIYSNRARAARHRVSASRRAAVATMHRI